MNEGLNKKINSFQDENNQIEKQNTLKLDLSSIKKTGLGEKMEMNNKSSEKESLDIKENKVGINKEEFTFKNTLIIERKESFKL